MSIPNFFRPHITFHHSITPFALDQLQQAIKCLGDDATDPSAVRTSTEPDVRVYLLNFLRQMATYSPSGTIRTIGVILLVPEFSLDLLHVADEDDDEGIEHEPSGQGSQYDQTNFARTTRQVLGYPPRESPDVDDMSPLIFRMIVRAPPPLPSATPRDRVEVVIPVRHRAFSRRSTPSLMLLPLLFIGRSSLPPPLPLPSFPLLPPLPAAVPNPTIVPNPAAVRQSSRPRRPALPPTPSTSTPSASAGIKIVDLALEATKRVHGIDSIVCALVIEIEAIFHNPIDPEHPPLPPRSVTITPGMRKKTCKGVGQAFAVLIGAFQSVGTFLGLAVIGSRFMRILVADPTTLVVELEPDEGADDIVDTVDTLRRSEGEVDDFDPG